MTDQHHDADGQQPASVLIVPQPQPMSWQATKGVGPDGKPWVMLTLMTASGSHVTFWQVEDLKAFTRKLREIAGDIVLPTSAEVSGWEQFVKGKEG